jgi:hypothetical protein
MSSRQPCIPPFGPVAANTSRRTRAGRTSAISWGHEATDREPEDIDASIVRNCGSTSWSAVASCQLPVSAAKPALVTAPYTTCAQRSSASVRASQSQIGASTFASGRTT